MKQKKHRTTVNIPVDVYKEVRFLAMMYNKTNSKIIIEALRLYADNFSITNKKDEEIKELKHTVYRLQYDSHNQQEHNE
jgi:metal-responsive CopG/Arc/MetJ family transcriptional regulator